MSIESSTVYRRLGPTGTKWFLRVDLGAMLVMLVGAPVATFTPLIADLPANAQWTLRGMTAGLAFIGLAVVWRMYSSAMRELAGCTMERGN